MNVEKWSIWLVNLEPVIGSEQGKTRPVVVISENYVNEILDIINILPVSGVKPGRRIYPNEVMLKSSDTGLVKDSIILCHQIRTIDKRRLIRRFGTIDEKNIQTQICIALKFQLGL